MSVKSLLMRAIEDFDRGDRIDCADSIALAVDELRKTYGEYNYSELNFERLDAGHYMALATVSVVSPRGAFVRTFHGRVFAIGDAYVDVYGSKGAKARMALASLLSVPINRINNWRKAKQKKEADERREEEIQRLRVQANQYGFVLKPFGEKSDAF